MSYHGLKSLFILFILNRVATSVNYHNNGYDITVAISRNVTQDHGIITELQSMFTSASEYLYLTTRSHFYIRSVAILVPDTWTINSTWTEVEDKTFSQADLRIDTPHPAYGDNPYTFQPGQCGEEGRYIHLTPDFVLNTQSRDFYYGDAGRLLVHEFAHLRFGVFDEYGYKGSSQHPVYYVDDNDAEVRPTACSKEITGYFSERKKERSCATGDPNHPVADYCDFYPSEDNNDATSSVMYAQYLDLVTHFCEDNPTDPKLKHNMDAPNTHNKMCNSRGTWDVISQHVDMDSTTPGGVADRTPGFDIQYRKQEGERVCGRRFVFVLDLSRSMKNNERYFRLRQMTDKTIRDILPLGTEMGIVVFSNNARVWTSMTSLTSVEDRERIASSLPVESNFSGSTAIGLGLLEAIKLLRADGKSAEGGRVFLITDGDENVKPNVEEVMVDIISSGVTVHTLAYSDAAATVLRSLSSNTGGQYSYFDESGTSSQLDGTIHRLLKDVSVCEDTDDSIEIDRYAVLLTASEPTAKRSVIIDSTVGNNTIFIFTLSQHAYSQITVEDPLGNQYGTSSSYYSKDSVNNIVRFLVPFADPGTWSYTVTRGAQSEESVECVVKSNPNEGVLPFEVDAWVSSSVANYSSQQFPVVYVHVHQGYSPMLLADVTVTVARFKELPFTLQLKDDGILPDNAAEDGVYCSYLIGFGANERYSMETRATSIPGRTVILKMGTLLTSRALPVNRNQSTPVVYEPVENFTRIASVGAVDVLNYYPDADQVNPGQVTDLDLMIASASSRYVTLTWTAPGDDLNRGTVNRYDIRIAETFQSLRQNFSKLHQIENETNAIVKGSIEPLLAGSQQMVTYALPGDWSSDFVVVGLVAVDDGDRTSLLSNLKSVTFQTLIVPMITTAATTTSDLSMLVIGVDTSLGLIMTPFTVSMIVCFCTS